jgi:GT2 family glycosyltransferase
VTAASTSGADGAGISVLIVNWNACDDLRGCLRSLYSQTDRDFEVVVVDNGSADASLAMVRSEFPEVKLLEAGENLGFAEGCNRGMEVVSKPWVFALNNDTRLHPDAIASLRRAALSAGPRLGMLQARILFMDQPHLTNSTGVLLRSDGVFIDRDFAAPLRQGDVQQPIFCVSAGAALYRRAMLEAVRLPTGVFDRSFFMYFEDVDLGWRCRLAGWEAEYVPAALVYHRFHGSTTRQRHAFVATHCHANKVRTLLKNASLRYIAKVLPVVLVFDVMPLFRHQKGAALGLLGKALRDGWEQRVLVRQLSCQSRRDIERRWVVRKPRAGQTLPTQH